VKRKIVSAPTKKELKKEIKTVVKKADKKVKAIKKQLKKAPKGPKTKELKKKLVKAEVIKGGRKWVNARTKTLKDKIKRNRVLIKGSTDKAKITVWETEIEEWSWEITYITEVFMSDEVQKQLKVINKKPSPKPTTKNVAKAKAVLKKSAAKINKIKQQLKKVDKKSS
jgi:small-conductance mechanosensitive channel